MAKLDMLAIAVAARDMIDKGWTKGTWRREGPGQQLFVCTEGAIQEAMRLQIKSELQFSAPLCEMLNKFSEKEAQQITTDMAVALSRKREQLVFNYLCKVLGVQSIPSWNDNRSRQKHEVLALFDTLIDQLQNLGEGRFVEAPENLQEQYAHAVSRRS